MTLEQHLTTAEVAKRLKLREETVRVRAARGELGARRIGKLFRFPESAIAAEQQRLGVVS